MFKKEKERGHSTFLLISLAVFVSHEPIHLHIFMKFNLGEFTTVFSIPGTTRKRSSGSGTGSTQPREYN
jgi:hypothetical protein